MKNKKVFEKWKSQIDFQGVAPLKIMQFHEANRKALKQSIFYIDKENSFLKERIKELEKALIPKPLFVEPLNAIQPILTLRDVPKRSSKLRDSSSLLLVVRKYVEDGIHKIIYLTLEVWELAQNSTNFSTSIMHFREKLQKDLENDEGFYKEVVGVFATKVSILRDTHKRE
jgi:hypothetical protein